jgi:hypothetical protein
MLRRLLGSLALFVCVLACGEAGEAPVPPPATEPAAEAPEPASQEPADGDLHGESQGARGLVRREPGVSEGYVLYGPLLSKVTYLVDNDGRVVHTWRSDFIANSPYLQPDGSLLRIARDPTAEGFRAGGVAGYVERIGWDSDVLWRWHYASEDAINHHDIEPLPNGNLLLIGWERRSREQAIGAGRRPELTPEQGLWPDFLLEVEPVPPDDARVVWEWHAFDHLVQDYDAQAPNHGKPAEHPGRIDINAHGGGAAITPDKLAQLKALGYVPADATVEDLESDFLHVNSVAYNGQLDQIAISVPEFGEVWILDHSTTTEEAAGSSGGRQGPTGAANAKSGASTSSTTLAGSPTACAERAT